MKNIPLILSLLFFTLPSFTAFSNVSVTQQGTFPTMCVGGAAVDQIDDIVIEESNNGDFNLTSNGYYDFAIIAPSGYEFVENTGSVSTQNNRDFENNYAANNFLVFKNYIRINLHTDGSNAKDAIDRIIITGLKMRALSGTTTGGALIFSTGYLPCNPGIDNLGDFATCAVSVPSAPTFTGVNQPIQTRCGTGNVTYTPSGGSSYNLYTASSGGSPIDNGTTVTANNVSVNTTFFISKISSGCESPARTTVQALINTAPSITSQPTGQNPCTNETASYLIAATGSSLNYQWTISSSGGGPFTNVSGAEYLGATSTNLTINPVDASMDGKYYRCTVSGGAGCSSVNSSAVTLTIPASAAITAQPTLNPTTFCSNQSATISISATNQTSYQWEVDPGTGTFASVPNSAPYSNTTSSTLNISAGIGLNGYRYRCAVGSNCGSTLYSNTVVVPVLTTRTVSTPPSSKSICEGNFTTFDIALTGTVTAYQWRKSTDNGSTWNDVSNGGIFFGATTPTLFVIAPTAATDNNTQFLCNYTGGCSGSTISSSTATLTVNGFAKITSQPQNRTICITNNTTFSITADYASSYQWQVNNGAGWSTLSNNATYSGATSATLTLSNATLAMNGYSYRCSIDATSCSSPVVSDIGYLNITQAAPDFTGLNAQYCINGDSTLLVPTPTGGTITGAGIYNAGGGVFWFNPKKAGASGTKNITYTYSASGCSFGKSHSTILLNKPTVNFIGLSPGYSSTVSNVSLNALGIPSGGGYSFGGTAVSGTVFNPLAAGVGPHTIYAYYTNLSGCKDTVSASVVVVPQSGSILGLESSYCTNSPYDTIVGIKGANGIAGSGTWNYSGNINIISYLSDSAIVLSFPLSGSFDLFYEFNSNTCAPGSCITTFSTRASSYTTAPPVASFNSRKSFCLSDNPYTLVAVPVGGVFTGTGVTFNAGIYAFDPTVFPNGTSGHQFISYSYVDPTNGCRSTPDPLVDWMNINPTPLAPVIDSITYIKRVIPYCQGAVVQSWVPQPVIGTTYYWYADAGLTLLVGVGPSFAPIASSSIVATTSYFVRGYNGSCFGPVTEVKMIINQKGFVNAGIDKLICEGTTNVAINVGSSITGSTTTGVWNRVGGGGNFSTTTFGGPVNYTPIAADILAGKALLALVTNDPDGTGPCTAVKDTVEIRINYKALVDAGAPQLICESNTTILISTGTSILGGTSTGVWSRDGAIGAFLNGTSYSHVVKNTITYSIDAADITTGFVNLVLTSADPDGIGPCVMEDDTVKITINHEATVATGATQIICAKATPTLTATILNATIGGAGSSFTWTGGLGTFSIASGAGTNATTTYTPSPSELAGTIVIFTLTSNDPDGVGPCGMASNTTTIKINQRATINVPSDTIICAGLTPAATQLSITANAGDGAYSYTWSGGAGLFSPLSGLAPNASTIYQPATLELTNTTPFMLYATTDDPDDISGPCTAAKDSMLVTINRRAIVNAGIDKTICSGITSVNIAAGASISGGTSTGFWTKVENAGTFNPNNLFTTALTYIPLPADTANGGIHLVVASIDPDATGPCTVVTDTLFIAVGKGATVEAGINQTVCAGATGIQTPVNLSAAFIGGSSTSATWSGGLGTFTPVSNIFVGATNVTYIPDASELVNGAYKIYLTSNDPDGIGPCLAAKDSMLISINGRTIVNAGSDKTICEGTTTLNLMIGASISGGTTLGSWTKVENVGVFSPDDQITSNPIYNVVVSDTTNGGIHFVLSSVDPDLIGPCLITRDTVFVKVNKAAYLDAGAVQNVCAGASSLLTPVNLSSANISGSASSAAWTGGNGIFTPAFILGGVNTVNYYPDISELFPGGAIKLYLTTNDPDGGGGPCLPAKDSVAVTINPRAVVNAGLDHIVCENTGNIVIFSNSSITGGTSVGYWERSGGGGTFISDNSYNSGTQYQLDANDITAGFVNLALISNDPDAGGPCTKETDTVKVTIRYLPLVNAGTDSVVCAGDTTISTFIYLSDATISGSTFTGSWSGGAGSFFPSAAIINARYIPHTSELISGIPIVVTLRSSDPPGPCGYVEDAKTITINPRLFVSAGIDQTACSSGPTLNLDGSIIRSLVNAPGTWTTPRGSFGNPTTPTTTFTVDPLDRPAVGAPAVKLKLKLTGNDPDGTGPCSSMADSMIITVYGLPNVDISGLVAGYCQKPGETVTLMGTPLDGATGSGFYIDPTTLNDFLGGGTASGLTFVPSAFGSGLHTLRFSYIHPSTGCVNKKDKVVSLKAFPFPAFQILDSCATRAINIIDTTDFIAPGAGQINQYLWEFGEDNAFISYSTQTNPSYTYNDPGNYNLKLTCTTDSGCVSSTSKLLYVGPIPKTDFQWTGICPADVTNFTDLSGFNPLKVQNYTWNFGDSPLPGSSALRNPTYDYSTLGSYNVTFSITSTNQCDSTITKKVNILPFAAPTSTTPYVQDFNAGDGNWAISGKNPSWEYGIPLAKQAIVHPNNLWVTKLSGVYNIDEKSYLDGPCFDFSSLNRPMISLKVWSASQQQIAGATIEASENGGASWQRIGGVDEGINWYDYPNVIGNPGNQTIAQGAQGWTGQYGKWKVAKIGLPQYSFSPNVRIRIAFGSGLDALGLSDGFALDSVHVGNKSKIVLLEHFTNNNSAAATAVNPQIDKTRSDRPEDIAVIAYHTSFPNEEIYSSYNFSDPSSRVLHYGIPSVPRSVLDGDYYNESIYTPSTTLTSYVDKRSLENTVFNLSLNTTISPGLVKVGTKIRYKDASVLQNGVALQVVVVEDSASGVNTMNSVLRMMMPDASGTFISSSDWGADSTFSVYNTYTHTLPASAKLNVIAFVQNIATKDVYQVAFARGTQMVGDDIVDRTLEKQISDWNVNIFPNPASESATIFFGGSTRQPLTWTLLDEVGQVMSQGTIASGIEGFEINTSRQASGMYILKIQDEQGGSTCKKIVVAK